MNQPIPILSLFFSLRDMPKPQSFRGFQWRPTHLKFFATWSLQERLDPTSWGSYYILDFAICSNCLQQFLLPSPRSKILMPPLIIAYPHWSYHIYTDHMNRNYFGAEHEVEKIITDSDHPHSSALLSDKLVAKKTFMIPQQSLCQFYLTWLICLLRS